MARSLPILLLLIAVALVVPHLATAQSPIDYGRLLGGSPAQESAPEQSTPRQSSPRPSFDPASVPSAEAYSALGGETGTMLETTERLVEVFRARAAKILYEAPEALYELKVTLSAASRTGEPGYFLGVALFALVLLAVGRAISNLAAAFIFRPIFVGMQKANPKGYSDKLPILGARVLLTLGGSAIVVMVASGLGLVYYGGDEATLHTAIVVFAIYVSALIVDMIWRMMLCPFLPNYRIPAIGTLEARRLYRWLTAVSSFGVISIGFGYWISLIGLPREGLVLFSVTLSGVMILSLLVLIRTCGDTINKIILDGKDRRQVSWVTLFALRLWAPLATLYLLAAWGKFAFDMVMGIATQPLGLTVPYLVMLGGTLLYATARFAIERVFARRRMIAWLNRDAAAGAPATGQPSAAEGVAGVPAAAPAAAETEAPFPERLSREMRADEFGSSGDIDGDGIEEGSAIRSLAGEDTEMVPMRRGMQSFEELGYRVASLFAIGAGAYGLLYYWGGPGLFDEAMLLGIAEDVIDIVFVGYVLFHAVRIWIDRRIADEGVDDTPLEPGEGEGGAGASRVATLLPLIRSFVLGSIVLAVVLVLASELGFNVAPLFAGAGILGLAIGFGSQTLVRDILSGAFFLADDAFRRGEYIDVGEVKGTVEKISLRSFQLRHHLGMLHTIPFGEISHLTNFSRDWVMMKLPLRLTYDTDVEKVRKLVKKLGVELLDDPVIGDKFLQPLKSQGVIEMQDSAMIIRVKFMTKPGEQWVIRKRVFQEIRDLFEREGIKFAHREVTVRIPDLPADRPLSEQETRAIGSAARTALDVIEGEQRLQTGTGGAPVDR